MLFRSARHQAPGSRWKKRILGIPVVGWVVGLALPAAALVGFILLFGANGTVTSSNGLDVTIVSATGTNHATSGSPATCTVTEAPADGITFALTGFDPGDVCQASISLQNNSTTDAAEIEGFLLESADWSTGAVLVELEDCAKNIAPSGLSSINVFFTGTTTITPGQSFTFDPAVDGLSLVPVGTSDPANCTVWTP